MTDNLRGQVGGGTRWGGKSVVATNRKNAKFGARPLSEKMGEKRGQGEQVLAGGYLHLQAWGTDLQKSAMCQWRKGFFRPLREGHAAGGVHGTLSSAEEAWEVPPLGGNLWVGTRKGMPLLLKIVWSANWVWGRLRGDTEKQS